MTLTNHNSTLPSASGASAYTYTDTPPPPLPAANPPRASKNKRKRTDAEAETAETEKKKRRDAKKEGTERKHERMAARDAAMKRWLAVNKDIFIPLLPDTRAFADSGPNGAPHAYSDLVAQPDLIQGGEMKDYQLKGLSFLVHMYKNGMNCILGDEMGLGKTLQTLALFAWIKENSSVPIDAPHLVICPLSVLSSWEAEAARWLPSLRVLRVHGSAEQRSTLKKAYRGTSYDLVITTYESYAADDGWFKTHSWTYCVLDEGHRIKNPSSQKASRIQMLGSLHRLILTGTPVQNDLGEVWGLLRYLYPAIFTERTEARFRTAFNLAAGTYDMAFLNGVQKLLSVIMLRRTKDTVQINVPPREELTVFIPLTEAQRYWTYRLLTHMDKVDLEQIFDVGTKTESGGWDKGRQEVLNHLQSSQKGSNDKQQWQRLNFMVLQLMRLCDHPYLLPDAAPEPYIPGEHLVASSSKLIVIDKILADVLPKGEQVLIFSQWTGMLDVLSEFLKLRGIPFARLDGNTLRPRRALDIKLFQRADNSPYKVYLISTAAGGLGINLTRASTVIMADSMWNPQNDLQAIARAHRIGQTKIVKVYRLICRASVEDQMLDRIRRKLFLSLKVMDSGSEVGKEGGGPELGLNELRDILRRGSTALDATGGMSLATFLEAPIAEILDGSRQIAEPVLVGGGVKSEEGLGLGIKVEDGVKTEDGVKLEKEEVVLNSTLKPLLTPEEEEQQLLAGAAIVRAYLFEGKMVESVKRNDTVVLELGKRARTQATAGLTPDQVQTRAVERHAVVKAAKVKKVRQFENEDYCIFCRDGGSVTMCEYCPRVFHNDCAGLKPADLRKTWLKCPQHDCHGCSRNTNAAGGMLFRCQTCPRAFCEDCAPTEPDIVGEMLPEFQLLGFGATSGAYFIRCEECRTTEKAEPQWWAQAWGKDLSTAKGRVERGEHLQIHHHHH